MIRKFMTTVAVGSLFVGGLAATHLAFAQPGAEGGPGPRGGMMMRADTDKDGKISKAEMTAALEARFAKMDVDRDGQLTAKDRDLMRKQRMDTRFAAMDSDKNGQISKAEFTAAHEARAEKREEMRGRGGSDGHRMGKGKGHHRGMMRGGPGGPMAEARKDGIVTKAEFVAGPLAMFDKADANKDGFVTADEMKAAHQAMRQDMRAKWQNRNAPSPADD
ncbi:Ca2+-binding EF-hand superfamily protein [Sphingobium sp. OAS761]|uniref:EF-hand domain-containing protein n=1 Tax=Sphingobium sp. OAS761 TaxID=2817901 RepID=UPI0020A18361|nr:EF-hand domain-containing protein [Sphingobium sp. OAS761]MCP1471546.1 Ca2+-binding EF-hand superfamily protein [Sphingobium sp. OAS761]